MDMTTKNLLALHQLRDYPENEWDYKKGDNCFIDYILEDKSKYSALKDNYNPTKKINWIDPDDDFLVGDSGGILMKIDFIFVNTNIFTRVADFYMKHGKYTLEPEGSPEYIKFWKTEYTRRIKGVEAKCKLYFKDIEKYLNADTDKERDNLLHYVRITGDHYNYLNYGRIERAPNKDERKELDKKGLYRVNTIAGFPRFWDGDYWDFKVDELASLNGYNICEAKARRKGFSYKKGSKAANTLNTIKNSTVTMVAYDMDYLTSKGKVSTMAKTNLDWYEVETEWKRGYISESYDKGIELGYKKTSTGHQTYGFKSKLLSVSTSKNPSAAVGSKALEINFEEAGIFRNLQQVINLVLSNMESGALTVGMFRVFGTGGDKEADWTTFKEIFYNPKKNYILPLENVWDKNSRRNICGFFFPQVWCYEPYITNGNSLLFTSWKEDKTAKDEAEKQLVGTEYNIYVGQRANSPSEAFSATKENIFHSPELTIHLHELETNQDYKFYRDGWYILQDGQVQFKDKIECIREEIFKNSKQKFHDYITDVPHITNKTDVHGCIREFYPPIPNNGDLYFISADTYRVDKNIKKVVRQNSLYAFQVWMRIHELNTFRRRVLVASYTGRLDTMEENDKMLLYAALRYNCKVLIEAGTGETIPNFKKWGYKSKLLKDPTYYINRSVEEKTKDSYGIFVDNEEVKLEGLRMLKDMLYSVVGFNDDGSPLYLFQTIYDYSFLQEINIFDFEGNFDRISAAIVAVYEYQKDAVLLERSLKNKSSDTHKSFIQRILAK